MMADVRQFQDSTAIHRFLQRSDPGFKTVPYDTADLEFWPSSYDSGWVR